MSNLIPEGWDIHKINDISKVGSSKRILQSEYVADGVPFFRSKEVILRSKRKTIKDTLYISRKRFEELKNKFSAPIAGDILVTAVGTIGVIYLVEDLEFYFKDGNLLWVKDINGKVSSEYLAKYMASDFFQASIGRITSGSSQAALTIEKLSELEFNLPPFPEQQKIAKVLTSVDEVIEKTQAQIDKLKDLKTGMMQELLTHGIGHTEFKDSPVGRIPADWEVKTVESVLSKIIDYRGKAPPKSEVGVPLITAKNIRNGFINQEPREYIYEDQFDSWMVRGMPQPGDVFITTEAPLGNVAKVPNYKFAIGQRVLTLRPNELVCTQFLLFILQSEKFKKELDLQSTGSTVAGIKQSTFRKVLLPVPTIDEQIKISESLNSIVRRSDVVKDKLQSFKSLKKALMQDLLTGKVRVKVDSK